MLIHFRRLRARRGGGPRWQRLGKDGFSLAETLTAVAITAIVASVVVSRTVAPRANSEAVAIVQTLYGVVEAMTAYRGTVGRYPATLQDLVLEPSPGLDTCGRTIPPHFLDEWQGPYLRRSVDSAGIQLGDAVLRNWIIRTPPGRTGSSLGTLTLDIVNVEEEIAIRVNQMFDEDENLFGGTVRWSPQGDGSTGRLAYDFPIRGC